MGCEAAKSYYTSSFVSETIILIKYVLMNGWVSWEFQKQLLMHQLIRNILTPPVILDLTFEFAESFPIIFKLDTFRRSAKLILFIFKTAIRTSVICKSNNNIFELKESPAGTKFTSEFPLLKLTVLGGSLRNKHNAVLRITVQLGFFPRRKRDVWKLFPAHK
jgi:hypothetical protein